MKNRLKLAFCLFEYVPFGGMQSDMVQIAETCMSRGHHVEIFARYWQGNFPGHLKVRIISGRGFTNHRRCESFAGRLNKHLASERYDAVVGFNKMPGLDVYFAADTCFAAKVRSRGFLYRIGGRCRSYLRLERAVFDKHSETQILLLSEREKIPFLECYGTQPQRFHLLPPGISKDRMAPDNAEEVRAQLRRELGIGMKQNIVLMVGSGFKTKGVDRAIRAISSLPPNLLENVLLLVVGEGKKSPFLRSAKRTGMMDHVRFIGGREDVGRFLASSDLLLHPAYREMAGKVLLEAMASGLPVLATDVCGYAHHVQQAHAGKLVPSPFRQEKLNEILAFMLSYDKKEQWKNNGRDYIANNDVFSLSDRAADLIERIADDSIA